MFKAEAISEKSLPGFVVYKPQDLTGGTLIMGPSEQFSGVGHCSVYQFDGQWYFIAHAYDKALNGASKLFMRPIEWVDGWPVIKE